jgi:flagellin-like hook-associated protein FlgL
MQAAFNQNSTDGTPSVFTVLATLRDTLDQEPAATESQRSVNVTGQVIQGAGDANPTTLATIAGPPAMTSVPLTPDSSGNYSITINGTNPATGANTSVGPPAFTFAPGTTLDGPGGVIATINAQTGTTGVTAAFNVQTQRITLTSTAPNSPPFSVNDASSAGATNTSNFLEAFQIPTTGSVTTNLSTQIGDIDDVINQVLAARAQIGQQIQNLAGTTNQLQALSTDNTTTQSGYQDTNVAQATSQFTLTQTALQAAYATTTRLEGKSLIDYL